jgi:hypothetical protein
MISLVIGITMGVIQPELLLPILDSPMRFAIPLAPANFLYLKDNSWIGHDKKAITLFPDNPTITDAIEQFASTKLHPHLIQLHEKKDQFQEVIEMWPRFKVQDYDQVIQIYNDWRKMVDNKKEEARLKRQLAAQERNATNNSEQPNKKQKVKEISM